MSLFRNRGHVILICTCFVFIFSGCSATSTNNTNDNSMVFNGLPQLPDGKLPSELTGSTIEGSEFFDKQDNASVAAGDLELDSSPDSISWGMWELVPGSGNLVSVEILLSVEPGHQAYVAIADYSVGHWVIDGPLTDSKLYTLNSVTNLSIAGNCYVAVIASGGDDAVVDRLLVTVDRSGWQIVTVDTDGNVGEYSSLVVVDGNPAISYLDMTNYDLKYVRSMTPTGVNAADWGEPVIVDSEGTMGYYGSLAVVDGTPAISYTDLSNFNLMYIRSTTSTGAGIADWSQKVIVDDVGTPGYYSSLAVINGKPAISYHEVDEKVLKYARSTTPKGASAADWSMKATVDDGVNVGWFSSLAMVDDNPAIAYYDAINEGVKYSRSTTGSGALSEHWNQDITVSSAGNGGQYTSLAIVDGNPAISYYSLDNLDVMFARSTTSTGTKLLDWSQEVTVYSPGVVGAYSSLAIVDGNPAISYIDITNKSLGYIRSTTASGGNASAWLQEPDTVDSWEDPGKYTSLAVVDGRPAISYQDGNDNGLKYAILFD